MPNTEVAVAPRQTLFQITETLCQLFDMLESSEPDEREAITAEIDRVVGAELSQKVDGIARWDRECDLEVAKLQSFVTDIEKRIGAINNRKRQVREMTLRAMKALGATKLRGDVYTISTRAGSESVDVLDEGTIPVTYFNKKETYALDKARVKADLKAGKQIPGASLKTGSDVLTIR